MVLVLYTDDLEDSNQHNNHDLGPNIDSNIDQNYTLENNFINNNTKNIQAGLANRFIQKIPPKYFNPKSFIDLPKKFHITIPPPIIEPKPDTDLNAFIFTGAPAVLRRDITENVSSYTLSTNNTKILYSITRLAYRYNDLIENVRFESNQSNDRLDIDEKEQSNNLAPSIISLRESTSNPVLGNLSANITSNDYTVLSIPVFQTAGINPLVSSLTTDTNYFSLYSINKKPTPVESDKKGFFKIISPENNILNKADNIKFLLNHPLNTLFYLYESSLIPNPIRNYYAQIIIREYRENEDSSITENFNNTNDYLDSTTSFSPQQIVINKDNTLRTNTFIIASTPNNNFNHTIHPDTQSLEIWTRLTIPVSTTRTNNTNNTHHIYHLLKQYYVE